MIYPYKIKWRNVFNVDKDVITDVVFSEQTGNSSAYSLEAVYSDNGRKSRRNVSGYKYGDPNPLVLTLMKPDFSYFTVEENRCILSWLTGAKTPGYLDVYLDDSEVITYSALGNFTSVEQYKLDSRIVGYEASFELAAPYVYSREQEVKYAVHQPFSITLTNASDATEERVYPTIYYTTSNTRYVSISSTPLAAEMYEHILYSRIVEACRQYYFKINNGCQTLTDSNFVGTLPTPSSSNMNTYYIHTSTYKVYQVTCPNGTYIITPVLDTQGNDLVVGNGLIITNTTNNTKMVLKHLSPNEVVTIQGESRIISSTRSPQHIFSNDFNWQWLGLSAGRNNLTILGNSATNGLQFKWRYPIKMGDQ